MTHRTRYLIPALLLGATAPTSFHLAVAATPQQNTFYAFAPPAEPYARATQAARQPDAGSFTAAPMPDAEINVPTAAPPDDPNAAQVSPELYRPQKEFRGNAFTYGSTNQGVEQRSVAPAPGVSVKMPLY